MATIHQFPRNPRADDPKSDAAAEAQWREHLNAERRTDKAASGS